MLKEQMSQEEPSSKETFREKQFSGNIFIFHAFDVGDEINLQSVQKVPALSQVPLSMPKYFKNYHTPLSVELPHPHESSQCVSCKIYNFGAISLTYRIPFTDTLMATHAEFNNIANLFRQQSIIDAKSVYKKMEYCVSQPSFFQMNSSYVVVQLEADSSVSLSDLKTHYGHTITSMLRFETENLSEYQKNEMLKTAIGYYRGDLMIIDTDATFFYGVEQELVSDLFEFANIQQLELRYFDRLLDQQLNRIYESEGRRLSWHSYLPFATMVGNDPVTRLGKLKVDISVITERLESTVKLAGEPYISEIYEQLAENLDLTNWHHAINCKLTIVHDIQSTHQAKIDVNREDLLTILIIILIFIELLVGLLGLLK